MDKPLKLNKSDVEKLVCHIVEYDYENADYYSLDSELKEKWGIHMHTFSDILRKLLPLIDIGTSLLTHKRYKGFSDQEGKFFVQMEIEKE